MPLPSVDLETKEKGQTLLLPPYNYSLRQIVAELEVGLETVQKWRQELKDKGVFIEQRKPDTDEFSAEQKFAFILQTASMSEHELAAFCRKNGLFVEQVKSWRAVSIEAHQVKKESQYKHDTARRADKKRIKDLERELNRKDKALAETAALLVLREK